MIVENLKYFLYQFSEYDPLFFGTKFNQLVYQGYMSGGAGYVISKEALRRLVIESIPDHNLCEKFGTGHEDVDLGSCLENVGVLAGDSRDLSTSEKRGRFFPYDPASHLFPPIPSSTLYWYWVYIYYKTDEGIGCLSEKAISFHYISPREMYFLDYFVYSLKPYGILNSDQLLPPKVSYDELEHQMRAEKANMAKKKYAEFKANNSKTKN